MMNALNYDSLKMKRSPVMPETGETLHVNPEVKNPISSVVKTANANSTVIIPEGQYCDNIVVDKPLSIIAEGKVVISSENSSDTIILNANSCYIKGIQITTGNSQATTAISIKSGDLIVEECAFVSENVSPILISSKTSSIQIKKTSLQAASSCAIKLSGNMCLELIESQISNPKGVGVMLLGSSILKAKTSVISGCGDAGIVSLENSSFFIEGTQVSENQGNGVEIDSSGELYINSSFISANKLSRISGIGNSQIMIHQTTIDQCHTGIFADSGFHTIINTCQITNSQNGALVVAKNNSKVEIQTSVFQGKCVAAIYSDNSEISINGSQISNIAGTGLSAINGGKLSVESSVIKEIQECGCEISNKSNVKMHNTTMESIESIGILLKTDSSCDFNTVSIDKCGEVCCHFIDTNVSSKFEKCAFMESSGNGFNVGRASPEFIECNFHANTYAGLEIKGENTSPHFTRCQFSSNKVVGVNVLNGASPEFSECTFASNIGSGLIVNGCKATVSQCGISNNGQMGVVAFGGASLVIEKSVFQENNAFALQVQQQNTSVNVNECEFTKHANSGAIILQDNCKMSINMSTIHDCRAPNIEARGGANLQAKNCELYNSNGGISIMIHDGAKSTIETSVIHDEKQAGILIGNNGTAEISGCDISKCDVAGVYMLQGSSGDIHGNKLHHNSISGVHIMAGSPKVYENIIEDQVYGIFIESGATPEISGNQFDRSSQFNVNRA